MRRHERAPQVGLAGVDRARGAQEEEAVVALGAQREDRRARVGVDEDLVPGGGAQRRAALTQRVGGAHQAHGVDRVVRERAMRGIRRVEPGVGVARRVRVPAGVGAGLSAGASSWAPASPPRRRCSLEVGEDDVPHQLAQRGRVGEQRRAARSTCCARPRARPAPAGRRRRRRRTVRRRPRRRCAGRPGRVVRETVEHVVHRPGERDVGAVQRVDAAAGRRRVVHPDVVHVGDQHREPDHEVAPVGRPAGQQDALDRRREIDDPRRDVAHVDDPVVGEQRGMPVGRTERVVVAQRLQRRALHHRPPEPLLEHRPELRGQMAVDRCGEGSATAVQPTRRFAGVQDRRRARSSRSTMA